MADLSILMWTEHDRFAVVQRSICTECGMPIRWVDLSGASYWQHLGPGTPHTVEGTPYTVESALAAIARLRSLEERIALIERRLGDDGR